MGVWKHRLARGGAALGAVPVLVALPALVGLPWSAPSARAAAGAALVRPARGAGRGGLRLAPGPRCPVPTGDLLPSAPAQPVPPPEMAIVGGSFTAGVGATSPAQGWAPLLARQLGWKAVVRGVPGAGYVRPGRHDGGPVAKELAEVDLARWRPALVIIQAGHNDIGAPRAEISRQVALDIATVRREDPGARLVLITVFVRGNRVSAAARATDRTIVAAARRADPGALVLDPLHPRWWFPRVADRLHPDEAGHEAIAARVARVLAAVGVRSYPQFTCAQPAAGARAAPGAG